MQLGNFLELFNENLLVLNLQTEYLLQNNRAQNTKMLENPDLELIK